MPQFVDRLTPPADTSFFSCIDQQVSHGSCIFGEGDAAAKVNWTVTFYTYATGANPGSPDFGTKGGQIYIIAVHKGSVTVPSWRYGKM
ncbi:hypothetical protein HGRIS_009004 [Hohenbuehelia grisea]|uniref:Uncharacterized protein n=1 Tax=Hohenbuehelia grisea TaxID=104357 RepID=A0ABR3IZW9_9AGAR